MGWYRVLHAVRRHRVVLWTGTECCWHLDGIEWHCVLVRGVAGITMVQSGIVSWYRVLLTVGWHRFALWTGTVCCWY